MYRKDNINENIEKMIEWLKTEEGKQFINEIKKDKKRKNIFTYEKILYIMNVSKNY